VRTLREALSIDPPEPPIQECSGLALSRYDRAMLAWDEKRKQALAAIAPKGDAKPAKFQSLADQREESQKIQRQAYKLLNGEPK
jgi:hypothetical protein